MARNYSTPRYKSKSRPGRKSIDEERRRKLITARVAPETYNYLVEQNIKIGLLIDQLVRKELLRKSSNRDSNYQIQERVTKDINGNSKTGGCETFDFDSESLISNDPYDVVTEQARGFLALIVERGTSHLTQEQIEIFRRQLYPTR